MGSQEGFVRRGLGGNSGFALWKYGELFSQTSELLSSSSLEGQAKKTGRKVAVTSFLRPHRGLRRGRARFPGKHERGPGAAGPRLWAGDEGRRTSPGRRPRKAPSLHPSPRKRRLELLACSSGCFKSRGKTATPGTPARVAELPPCSARRTLAPGAAGPSGPATDPPARPSPSRDGFRAPRRLPGGGGGAEPTAHLRA